MGYCEYRHKPKYGKCGLSEKYCGVCMRCENITYDGCESIRNMAREEEGGGEMTDTEIIEWLMEANIPLVVKQRCVGILRAQKYTKVEVYNGQEYCACGNPLEYSDQLYCDQCGAKLDHNEIKE